MRGYEQWRNELFGLSPESDPVMHEHSEDFYAVPPHVAFDYVDQVLVDPDVHSLFTKDQLGKPELPIAWFANAERLSGGPVIAAVMSPPCSRELGLRFYNYDQKEFPMGNRQFASEEAQTVGDQLGVDWNKIPLDEFRMGLSGELEHGANA